jgi:hypothetical protein
MPRKAETIEFSAVIPRELYRKYTALLPIHGANKWFIMRTLTLFMEEIERRPGIEAPIAAAVNRLVEELYNHVPARRETNENDNFRA